MPLCCTDRQTDAVIEKGVFTAMSAAPAGVGVRLLLPRTRQLRVRRVRWPRLRSSDGADQDAGTLITRSRICALRGRSLNRCRVINRARDKC